MYKIQIILFSLIVSTFCYASEQSVYDFSWLDPDKEIFVLQNRRFQKKSRLHLSAGYGTTLSGPFVDATAMQARATFFFTEQFGLEILYSKNSGENNDAYDKVVNVGAAGAIPFRRIIEKYYGAQLVWSPFYAKINTFNKIIYLDWFFSLGYGKLSEHNNITTVEAASATPLAETYLDHNAFLFGTGLKIFLSRYVDFRIDFSGSMFSAARPSTSGGGDENYFNYDLTFSLGIALF